MNSSDRAALTRTLRAIYREIGAMGEQVYRRILPGGRLPTQHGGTGTSQGAEPPLGNPASDGQVLSSTAAGARSWVAQASFDPTKLSLLTDGDPTDPALVFAAGDVIVIYG